MALSTASRRQSHYQETVYFSTVFYFWQSTSSPQDVLVLIWLTTEGWIPELTMEPCSVLNVWPLDWEFTTLITRPFSMSNYKHGIGLCCLQYLCKFLVFEALWSQGLGIFGIWSIWSSVTVRAKLNSIKPLLTSRSLFFMSTN